MLSFTPPWHRPCPPPPPPFPLLCASAASPLTCAACSTGGALAFSGFCFSSPPPRHLLLSLSLQVLKDVTTLSLAERFYRTRVGRCAERITLPHPSPPVSPHMHDGTRLTAPGSPQPTPHHSGALTVRAHAHVSLKSVPRHAFLHGCGGRLDQHVTDRSAHLPGRCRV